MLLFIVVLLEGFVTISLEILTIRQLTPMVGNSIIVTSLIIGIFLLFLAYGYRKGGTYQDHYSTILKKNFTLAAFGFGIGLSYIYIYLFFDTVRYIVPHSSMFPLLLYLLLITAPVVYLLGQTVPITLNLWKKQSSVGAAGGQVLHISTIGSFLGATFTALVLLNYLGVAWSIFIDFGILVFLTLLLMNIKLESIRFVSLLVLTCAVCWINLTFEKSFFIATNNYANYQVLRVGSHEHGRVLVINDSYSSYINDRQKGFWYIEAIKKILFDDLNIEGKQILVLGAGGFTLSAEKINNNKFTYVDIDQQIATIVKNHFVRQIKGDFIADDARHYLNTTSTKYDVIVSDAYSNRMAIAPHLLTREYFLAINNVLVDKGIAIFNIVARPMLDDAYSKRMDTTIRSVFTSCMATPRYYSEYMTNIIYVCKKSLYSNDKVLYTDDKNRATLDFFDMS